MSRITHIAAAVYLASQAADAMRIGYANWMFTWGHNGEAAAWDRGKAQYRADAGEAAALNPREAPLRIRYGLALEEAGRAAEAEREFLAAARLSRKYEPRWTLAGFYFRQNKIEPFWFWAGEALQVAYRDPEPLFALAWAVEKDGAAIRRRLPIETRPLIWRAWVLDAARHGRLDEVEAALDRLGGIDPQPIAEALLAGGRVQPLTRFGGHRALDWRPIEQEGVQFVRVAHGFALAFNGQQPEQCDVATRLLPATPAASRTKWPIEGSVRGLAWRSEPFGRDGIRVTLRYVRPPGETRAVGAARVAE